MWNVFQMGEFVYIQHTCIEHIKIVFVKVNVITELWFDFHKQIGVTKLSYWWWRKTCINKYTGRLLDSRD
jgi:hypothetical protein